MQLSIIPSFSLRVAVGLLVFFVPCTLLADSFGAGGTSVYVQVRKSQLRRTPQLWAPAVATLKYGDELEVVSDPAAKDDRSESNWIRVRRGKGPIGFAHVSAVTPRRVVVNPSANVASGQVESSEIVMAGKGFSKEVEKQFALKNPSFDFRQVDSLERRTASAQELKSFASAGKLNL